MKYEEFVFENFIKGGLGRRVLNSERLDWRVPDDALMEHGEHYTFSG